MIILHRIGTWVTALADYVAKARTITELSQLSDSQLDDIGLSRGQLNTAVKDLWVNNDAPVAAVTSTQNKPADVQPKAANGSGKGFSDYLTALYSARNRPAYMV